VIDGPGLGLAHHLYSVKTPILRNTSGITEGT
jgi:hypothetical protein